MSNRVRRGPLVASVRRELAAARAAVRRCLDDGLARQREAHAQLSAAKASSAERFATLARQRDAEVSAAADRLVRQTAALTKALRELAAAAAPDACGAPWSTWPSLTESQADRADRADRSDRGDRQDRRNSSRVGPMAPGLLRIGELAEVGVPALLPLLDATHLWLTTDDRPLSDGVIAGLLLRTLRSTPSGQVKLWIFDPGQLGGALAGFAPLATSGQLTFVGPGGLTGMLDGLVEEIQRINEQVLAGEHAGLAEAAAVSGRRPEPWRIAVLLGDDTVELSTAQRAQLDRITRTGVAAGVHIVTRGITLVEHPTVLSMTIAAGLGVAPGLTGELSIALDQAPPAELVTAVCKELAAGPPPATLDYLLPEELWTESSAECLRAPIGEGTDGELAELVLGDDPPHALIAGPSGSGKTNLIYAFLAGLTSRYAPSELELHLLDFKEGVSFARFAPSHRDETWLPHLRLVGINVNADREFGLALLRHLADELRRRAAAAKKHGATKLAELRSEDPGGHWPRIIAVIDEFQVLLTGRDAVTSEAVALLEDLARRGRSQGIHLVLASQDVTGIEALWGRSGLVGQFTLRIALPKARRVLAETNLAADLIPRHHAVINADSGSPTANQIVRLPNCGNRVEWQELQRSLWLQRAADADEPRLFDGDARPAYPILPGGPSPLANQGAVALIGETIDVTGRPATVRLNRAPGRNLAVLGNRIDEACAVLASAGLALARQHEPGSADFTILCLDSDAEHAAKALHAALPVSEFHGVDSLYPALLDLAESAENDRPHYVLAYALDAASAQLAARRGPGEPTGHELLRTVLSRGPERRTHMLAWWRTVARLRDDLGGIGARLDAIGAWVALDVHGNELAPLTPQPGGPVWFPREQRALFFDRAVHRSPEIIIPYEVTL
ncbi:hypothetical protein F4553_005491 [Allocatelliglobosispora scoriae]|uniref:FtsK domain-containing protein n=1 Tax=Allocatelliglobosispora scoriae TaxID=643052 RepID=A0A841BSL0_9ACTN|nr:FtsK/SpoIIIE domain-containing protein [Allocatelliglobosispora scoriae]MBB5872057.1 hypothetical protein [Allocatelliglobosispora scoriae]